MTTTHTVAELVLTPAAYDEVKRAFEAAGYQHAILANGMIDMSGVGVTRAANRPAIFAKERTVTTGPDGSQSLQVRLGEPALQGPGVRHFIDAMERISRGETTPRDEVEGMGRSWDDVEFQLAEERAFFAAQGLTHPTPARES